MYKLPIGTRIIDLDERNNMGIGTIIENEPNVQKGVWMDEYIIEWDQYEVNHYRKYSQVKAAIDPWEIWKRLNAG